MPSADTTSKKRSAPEEAEVKEESNLLIIYLKYFFLKDETLPE